jgi:hypothetical protein
VARAIAVRITAEFHNHHTQLTSPLPDRIASDSGLSTSVRHRKTEIGEDVRDRMPPNEVGLSGELNPTEAIRRRLLCGCRRRWFARELPHKLIVVRDKLVELFRHVVTALHCFFRIKCRLCTAVAQ